MADDSAVASKGVCVVKYTVEVRRHLVMTSLWNVHHPHHAPGDTRAHFSIRYARVALRTRWLVYISACATADAADGTWTESMSTNHNSSVIARSMMGNPGRKSRRKSEIFFNRFFFAHISSIITIITSLNSILGRANLIIDYLSDYFLACKNRSKSIRPMKSMNWERRSETLYGRNGVRTCNISTPHRSFAFNKQQKPGSIIIKTKIACRIVFQWHLANNSSAS